MDKLATVIFLVEVINSKEQEKRKIWLRGTNSRLPFFFFFFLPFAVNVNLNREVKHHFYVKRQNVNLYHVIKFPLYLSFTVHYFNT